MSPKECQELTNIKYKTMLIQGEFDSTKIEETLNIDEILDKESILSKLESWCKLDKTVKLLKLNLYRDILNKKHSLNIEESNELEKYLSQCLDKNNLQKVKDVQYDKDNGVIKNIPYLIFNNTTRKFYLKKNEKHVSTIKSLAPKKTHKKLHKELQKLDITDSIKN